MKLGQLDLLIVRALQEDARLSFRELAERLGSTTPTVSARVKALEDIGLLRGYRAQVDHAVLGGASYVLTLTVHPKEARAAHEAVAALPGVHGAHLLPGGRIVAHVHLRPKGGMTLAQLHQHVAEVPGLQTYEAGEVIRSHERPAIEELPEDVEVPCHQCKGPIHGDPIRGKFGERTHVFCCRQCLGAFRARFEEMEAGAKTGGATGGKAARPAADRATPSRAHPHHHHH